MKISRPSSQILVVTKSQLSQVVPLVFTVVFFYFWYYMILRLGDIPYYSHPLDHIQTILSQDPFLWLFVLFPILIIPKLIKSIKKAIIGEEITFNGITRTMQRNHKRVATFNEVENLQIRTIGGESEEYRLTVVLRNGRKIEIHTSDDSSSIVSLGDDIADILDVELIRK